MDELSTSPAGLCQSDHAANRLMLYGVQDDHDHHMGKGNHTDDHDDHMWKCTPKYNNSSPSPKPSSPSPSPQVSPNPSPSPSPPPKCEIQPWGQCGGKGGDCGCGKPGYKCDDKPYDCSCTTGYECRREVSDKPIHYGPLVMLLMHADVSEFAMMHALQPLLQTQYMHRCFKLCVFTSVRFC